MKRPVWLGDLPPTLTTEQAAEIWGISTDHLWALARRGAAPVTPLRLGRKLVWPTAAVLHSINIDTDAPDDADVVPIRDTGS